MVMLSDKGTYIATRLYSIFGEVKKEATMFFTHILPYELDCWTMEGMVLKAFRIL